MNKIKRNELPSVGFLKNLFYYDPEDGELYYNETVCYNAKKGMCVGYVKDVRNKYKAVTINGRSYLLHRIIWKMHYENEPIVLDHIDRDRQNNKVENLREATFSSNVFNVEDNRYVGVSGYRGVYKHKNKWRASLTINKKRKHLGLFDTPEEAHEVYKEGNKCLKRF